MAEPTGPKPHPPIWIGGNSKAARRRVVQFGQGWCPVIAPAAMASSIRTAVIDGPATFGRAVEELRAELSAAGRDPYAVDIQIDVPVVDFDADDGVEQALQRIDEFADLGATWAIVHVDASSVDAAVDYLSAFSELVMGRRQPQRPVNVG